jgi:D-cysteine desulfhydrase
VFYAKGAIGHDTLTIAPNPAPMFPPPDFPTPLRPLEDLWSDEVELWVKDDGKTHPIYGGNKVRKVTALVDDAVARGARRIITFGAAGSHHVLTTTLFARARGLECAAVLTPQPRTEHAVDTLRAALGVGLDAYPAPHALSVPVAIARALQRGDVIVPPGGSNVLGASMYAAAFEELITQLRDLGRPAPDWIVVALGTGGTAAGLLAGAVGAEVPTRVLGVAILNNPIAGLMVQALAGAILRRQGRPADPRALSRRFMVSRDYVGEGYGEPTAEGERATARALESGLELDPTYTAKAFARVLEILRRARAGGRSRPLRVVYLHTLSSVPLDPLLRAPLAPESLPAALSHLFFSPKRLVVG